MRAKTIGALIVALTLAGCSSKPTHVPSTSNSQETLQQQRDRAFEELDRRTGQ